jgi:hypothetical protein
MLRIPPTRILFALALFAIGAPHGVMAQCVQGNCDNGTGGKVYPDGSRFEGDFADGRRVQGTYHYTSGDTYVGPFVENLRHGIGRYTYRSGETFHGLYDSDEKVFGTYQYLNGNSYTGEYSGNKPNGFGTLTKADGTRIEGSWVDGKPDWTLAPDSIDLDAAVAGNATSIHMDKGYSKQMPRIFAVIVGVADHEGSANDLAYADDDARLFHGHLRAAFQREVSQGEAVLLTDRQATRDRILSELDRVFAKAGEQDYVIFYFSGHGGPGQFFSTEAAPIEHTEIKGRFRASAAKYRLCIADACFAGSMGGGGALENYSEVQQLRDARLAVLLSSSRTEISAERPDLRQGLFSYWLIRGMRGAADLDGDKYITAGELFVYTRKAVINASKGKQQPVVIGQQLDRIPLCRLK